jgi:uncharacterized membrane protein
MISWLRHLWTIRILTTFLTGSLALLPILITLLILNWIVDRLSLLLGPKSTVGQLLTSSGISLVGADHHLLAYILGVTVLIMAIWVLGYIVRRTTRTRINHAIDHLVEQLPIIRTVYKPVAQVVRMVAGDETKDLKGMTVVMCSFGDKRSVYVLALLPTDQLYEVDHQLSYLVYVPTSPIPMGGGLVFVPRERVIPMPDLDVDDLFRIYVSLGALAPEIVPS